MIAGFLPRLRRSSATLSTPTLEKVMSASPGRMVSKSTVRSMHTSGVLRRWVTISKLSPQLLMSWIRMFFASGAAQRCTSGASTPRIARVQA